MGEFKFKVRDVENTLLSIQFYRDEDDILNMLVTSNLETEGKNSLKFPRGNKIDFIKFGRDLYQCVLFDDRDRELLYEMFKMFVEMYEENKGGRRYI